MMNVVKQVPDGKLNVLVVDDDSSIRMVLRGVLERQGYRVWEASDGYRALEYCKCSLPDLVLMDISMPGMDGSETCRQLRALPGAGMVPLIMVTGNDDGKNIERAYQNGATDYITKPIRPELLRNRIKYVIRNGHTVRRLAELHACSQALIEALPDSVLLFDRLGNLVDISSSDGSRFAGATGRRAHLSELLPAAVVETVLELSATALSDRSVCSFEYEVPDSLFTRYMEGRISVTCENTLLLMLRDISQNKLQEQRIQRLAQYDMLTGLPNRVQFYQMLEQAMTAEITQPLAVIYVNLDRFKRVNAILSQQVGDQVLIEVARRLSALKNDTDGGGVRLSLTRLGSDLFGLLVCGADIQESLSSVVEYCHTVLELPFEVAGNEIFLTSCIGAAVCEPNVSDAEVLIGQAESALHTAKCRGNGSICYFSDIAETYNPKRLTIEGRLRRAIRDDALSLHYQPQKDIINDRITGVEALLRWNDEQLGPVGPAEFIPIAEESGLILEIGEWVMFEACRQAREWRGRWGSALKIGVNVSSLQFHRQDLPGKLLALLQSSGAEASNLEIELTESSVMSDSVSSIRALRKLKDLGVSLAIDDFGTGYSSLSYLSRFPLDTLKIDRSFIQSFTDMRYNAAIVSAIIAMAEALSLRVIAEGVETSEQLAGLRAHNCHSVQGYLISRPMPVGECTALLDSCLVAGVA